ncbi:MAG: ElyC/SanA/YdcF family protein [Opitutaceae bacterium]|nr:ElyC/SanA/YdcF family protein [Opitutaceae bacterium]
MVYWLKKTLGFWLMPVPFCLGSMTLGLLLMLSRRWTRAGRRLAIGGFALLLVYSNSYVGRTLIKPLETVHPAIPDLPAGTPVPARLAASQFIVVLGGGNGYAPGLAANHLLSSGALARITEAVRLLRVVPDAKLVVCGPIFGPVESHALVLARTAISLGIDEKRIVVIDHARDTEEEAAAVRRLVGGAPVALVTSAWHMPRAAALFRHEGIDALPAPADFHSHRDSDSPAALFRWELPALERSTLAVRERLGYLWIWLRGKT